MSLSERCVECDFPLGHHAPTCSKHERGTVLSMVERRPPVPMPNTAWTAEQMLTETLEEVRSGAIKPMNMLIFYLNDMGDGTFKPECVLQNISIAERIAYFQLGLHKAIDDWTAK